MTDEIVKLTNKIADAFCINEEERDAANEDMRFCNVDGGMWEDWLTNTHGSDTNRAKLEFDITTDYVNRYVGEQKLNRANVLFTPDDNATNDDDADLITGIYRADFKDNDGQISEDNAIEEVAETGIGHFKLLTKFEDQDPENENQNIHWEPIYNSFNTVVWDAQSKRIDKEDAKWCCVLEGYNKDSFESTFPNATPASAYEPYSRKTLDWSGQDMIYVAEYYERKIITETLHVYQNVEREEIKAYSEEDLKDIRDELIADGWEFVRERKIKRHIVEKSIFTCKEYLEEPEKIPGEYIPVIPMYGFRKYVDEKERYRGLVRKLKDANRMFNTSISRIADTAATSPVRKPVFTKNQIKGREYDGGWADQTQGAFNVINDLVDVNGNPILTGPVGYTEPPNIDPNTVGALEVTTQFVQQTTGNSPQDTIDPDASGKAINALRARENLNTQTMTDNILVGKKHSGKVYLSIANEIYAGIRVKRSMKEDGSESLNTLNQEIMDNETGKIVLSNNITDKRFKVDVEVGPQYESQREATVETLERAMQLVGPESKYFEPMMSMWMQNIAGTGLNELKEYNRNEMLKMGLAKPETEEEQAMLERLSQQADPQAELNQSIAEQQKAEARSLDASAQQKLADAQKKKAETVEILEGIGKDPDGVTRLKFNEQTGQLESANNSRTAGTG